MKRVLIFSLNYYPRFIGGAEVAIKEITDRIDPKKVEFHVVTLRVDSTLPRNEKIGNVLVHRIGFGKPDPTIADLSKMPLHALKYWYQFGAAFAASRLHRQYHFDGIWAMMANATGIPAGIFKASHLEVEYLLTLQEGDPLEYIEGMMRPVWPLFRRAFTSADALQSISNFLQSWGKRMGFHGKYAEVIPNAVDVKRFVRDFSPREIDAAKEKISKKPGDIFLITTSRLVRKNAVDDVIRALPQLPDNVHFLIYGIGPDEEQLRSLTHELDIEGRVHFMGEISHANMPLTLRACDIFVRPSRSEGMGNSFVEAMAAGLPVIATQEGGIADFLFDAKRNPNMQTTGWAVDKNSPEQIAATVKEVIGNPENVRHVTQTAREMVIDKYDWNLVARQMQSLFDRLLGGR